MFSYVEDSSIQTDNKEEDPLINYEFELSSQTELTKNPDESKQEVKLYKRRWWLLFVYGLTGLAKGQIFNTWPPLSGSLIIAYDWSDVAIAQIPGATTITCAVVSLPLMYLVQRKGLRFGMLVSIFSLVIGCSLAVICINTSHSIWILLIGYCFNGVTSSMLTSSSSLLSVTWFPVSERTTATAVCTMSLQFGIGLGFVTGPHLMGIHVTAEDVPNKGNLTQDFIDSISTGIQRTVYFDLILVLLCLVMIIAYFPSKPPHPPSKSQLLNDTPVTDYVQGVKSLLLNKHFWILMLITGLAVSTATSWLSLASANYRPLDIGQASAGWIGFSSIMATTLGSLIISRVADHLLKKSKLIMMVSIGFGIVNITILSCIQQKYIILPFNSMIVLVYILTINASIGLGSIYPLCFELGCEIGYPVKEGLVGCLVTIAAYLFLFLYYVIYLTPAFTNDTHWMSWTTLGCSVAAFILLFTIKDHYPRVDMEESHSTNNVAD